MTRAVLKPFNLGIFNVQERTTSNASLSMIVQTLLSAVCGGDIRNRLF